MEPSLRQELQDFQEEMNASFSKLQQRLNVLSRRSEEVESTWQTRVVGLESTVNDTLDNVRHLSHRNEALEHRLAQQKPEMENAIGARSATVRKLRNAYKVIMDLAERLQDVGNESQLTEEEIEEVIAEATAAEGSSSSSGSERTLRMRNLQHEEPTGESTRSGPASHLEGLQADIIPGRLATNEQVGVSPPSSVGSSSVSARTTESVNSPEAEESWSLQYTKMPGSCELSCGPVSPRTHMTRLGKQNLLSSLEGLASQDELSLRIHIDSDFAFVYDPVFLEAPGRTLLLDWGSDAVNESITKDIRQSQSSVFHTFVFPMQKKNWYYVGSHTWKIINFPPTWPELDRKARQKIVKKLKERCHRNIDDPVIEHRLERNELSQFCVEFTSTGLRERTKDLARQMGFEGRTVGRREQT